ncbi:MAG: ABC transporter substrate binding protein, partial [Bacteroidota bacterium]
MQKIKWFALFLIFIVSCTNENKQSQKNKIPVIGFLDFVLDPTLAKAKQGFFDALEKNGFSEKDSTIEVIYNNAQGDIPTLGQSCDLLISKNVDLIATNTTLSTITAVQRTKTIPVCMMVAPRPDLAKLTDSL